MGATGYIQISKAAQFLRLSRLFESTYTTK